MKEITDQLIDIYGVQNILYIENKDGETVLHLLIKKRRLALAKYIIDTYLKI